MPEAFQVIEMSPPLGVTGRPVTEVSIYATSGDVPAVPVSMKIISASTELPVTAVNVGLVDESNTPFVNVLPDKVCGVPTEADEAEDQN